MKRLAVALTIATTVSIAAPVRAFQAGASGTPSAYVRRGLTLRGGQLRIDAGPPDFALLNSGARNNGRAVLSFATRDLGTSSETFVGMGLGAAYGINNRFELGTLLLPVSLSPKFDFGDMEFYGRYKFRGGKNEVGGQVAISLPTNTANRQTNFALVLGVPALLHISPTTRLDMGAELEIILGDANGVVNLDVPVAVQFQVNDVFFAGPKAGLFLPNVEELELGVGGVAGFTISDARRRPVVDIVAELYWPLFLASGRQDAVNLDQFNLVFGARVFFSTSRIRRRRPSTRFPPEFPNTAPESDF